jgi:hypothetical protein
MFVVENDAWAAATDRAIDDGVSVLVIDAEL